MKNYFCRSCMDGEVGILFRLIFWWQKKCPECGDNWHAQREEFLTRRPRYMSPPPPPKKPEPPEIIIIRM